jgi:hypothetical protein
LRNMTQVKILVQNIGGAGLGTERGGGFYGAIETKFT